MTNIQAELRVVELLRIKNNVFHSHYHYYYQYYFLKNREYSRNYSRQILTFQSDVSSFDKLGTDFPLNRNIQIQQRLERSSQPGGEPWQGVKADGQSSPWNAAGLPDDVAEPAPSGNQGPGSRHDLPTAPGPGLQSLSLSGLLLTLGCSPHALGHGCKTTQCGSRKTSFI